MLRAGAVWDVIYEHPSYFTSGSLELLLGRAGLRVLDQGASFGGQYLWAEAVLNGRDESAGAPGEDEGLGDFVEPFGRTFEEKVAAWDERLGAFGGEAALWGAGSKGVTFATSVPNAATLPHVIDLNTRKHGRHVPVTGQAVERPEVLADSPVDSVVALNPLYEAEIAGQLAELGVDAEVLVA